MFNVKRNLKKKNEELHGEGRKQPFCAHIVCLQSFLTQAFKNQWTELQIIPGCGQAVHEVTKSLT